MESSLSSGFHWELSGDDPASQVIAQIDLSSGARKYIEDPFNSESEALESLSQLLPDIGALVTVPCSPKTINSVRGRAQELKIVIVVDSDEERLSLWRDKFQNETPDCETLLLPKDFSKADAMLRERLSEFECGLFLGKCAVYIPQRFRRIEKDLSEFLESSVLHLQREACSIAAMKSAKSWRKTLNQILNTKFRSSCTTPAPAEGAGSVVLVGAGPSLDMNIDILRDYSDRATIIATDGALNSLLKSGVVPDMAASMDGVLHCWRYFAGAGDRLKDIALAASVNTGSALVRLYPGKVSLYAEDDMPSWLSPLVAGLPKVKHGQCVGHFAFHVAESLKPEEIILVGFDLAYRDGQFHPKDMPYKYSEELKDSFKRNMVEVDAAAGGKVSTDLSMSFYLKYFERAFEASACRVIDATEGGAKKRGAIVKSLKDALSAKRPARKIIPEWNQEYNSCDFLTLLTALESSISRLGPELKRISQKAAAMKKSSVGNPLSSLPLDSPHFELLNSCCNFLLLSSYADILANYRPEKFDSFKRTLAAVLEDMESSRNMLETALRLAISGAKASQSLSIALVPEEEAGHKAAKAILSGVRGVKSEILSSSPLPHIWSEMDRVGAGKVFAFDGEVIADVWELPGAVCVDIKTRFEPKPHERSLWVPGYSLVCVNDELLPAWRNFVPPDVDCSLLAQGV